MTVTLKDVARVARISHQSVSQILKDGPTARRFNQATRARVRQAATALGYRPNTQAQAVRSGGNRTIGLLVDPEPQRSALDPRMLAPLMTLTERRQQHLMIARLPDDQLLDGEALPALLTRVYAAGLLVNYHSGPCAPLAVALRQYRIPAVWLNNDLAHDACHPDETGAARDLTTHLLAQGARSAMWVDPWFLAAGWPTTHFSRTARYEGYRQAMTAAGLAPILVTMPRLPSDQHIEDLLRAALVALPRPCAVLGSLSPQEMDLRLRCAHNGRTPDGVWIGSITSLPEPTRGTPYAAMEIPWPALVEAALDMLAVKLNAPEVALPSRVIPAVFHALR